VKRRIVLLSLRAPGLAVVETDGDRALWSRSKARKTSRCAITGLSIGVGDTVYRPVGDQSYRSIRVKAEALEALEPKGDY